MDVTHAAKLRRIRHLNDLLRCKGVGGEVMVSAALDDMGTAMVVTSLLAVASYSSFNELTDPHAERDFGMVDVGGTSVVWKIDYFDRSLNFRSPDPADPTLTHRVMTVMLAHEY